MEPTYKVTFDGSEQFGVVQGEDRTFKMFVMDNEAGEPLDVTDLGLALLLPGADGNPIVRANAGVTVPLVSISSNSGSDLAITATFNCRTPHGLCTGDVLTLADGVTLNDAFPLPNGRTWGEGQAITVYAIIDATHFSIAIGGTPYVTDEDDTTPPLLYRPADITPVRPACGVCQLTLTSNVTAALMQGIAQDAELQVFDAGRVRIVILCAAFDVVKPVAM